MLVPYLDVYNPTQLIMSTRVKDISKSERNLNIIGFILFVLVSFTRICF